MRWVLLWAVLVVVAVVFLTFIGLRLWRQFKALKNDLTSASRRMSEASAGGRSDQPSR